jgi:tetratricopeptide (TPR) repeat protein
VKRPQRNILLFVTTVVGYFLINDYLSSMVKLTLGTALVIFGCLLAILCKDFLIARSKTKKHDWEGAIEHYNKFERSLEYYQQHGINLPIFMSIYTYNGIALTNNNRAQCYMNVHRTQDAKNNLEFAVRLDKLYATPHINLAILAAQKGNESSAMKELEIARELGYKVEGSQRLIRTYLAKVNEAIGDRL